MRLSIIIPFFDETAFLRSAIRSIQTQRIDDLEILVVNDNPEHFSREDLKELTKGLPVELLTHETNRGLSAARNTGMAAARGDWIGFLDADDYYTGSGLSLQLAEAEATGADITHASTYISHPGSPDVRLLERDARLHTVRAAKGTLTSCEAAQFIVSSWSSLYRRDFLEQAQLTFDEAQPRFEDRLFVLQSVTAARSIAFLGAPVRVWRRRSGSISTAAPSYETHLLQIQLLEKCLKVIRAEVAANRLPPRFEKRELFNTVSRLIWDMEIIPALAAGKGAYPALGERVCALLGSDSFGHSIFDDPILSEISRVGRRTRLGRITRQDFFTLHKHLRNGAFESAQDLLDQRAPDSKPAAPPVQKERITPKLILHCGLHKTGSTYLQHNLMAQRDAFMKRGLLVPRTGIPPSNHFDIRPGGLPGHQGLLTAIRSNDETTWQTLWDEIAQHRPKSVLISCENMLMPTNANRGPILQALFAQLARFSTVRVVAMVRNPADWAEAFYREQVANGHRDGSRSFAEFMVDRRDSLLDFETLFAPFESFSGAPVRLGDFDDLRQTNTLWSGFCTLAGLPEGTAPRTDAPRYPTPDRETILALRTLNMLTSDTELRRRILRGFFTLCPMPNDTGSLISPTERIALIDAWQARSGAFAAARGYAPDLDAMRSKIAATPWAAPEAVPSDRLEDLIRVTAQSLTPDDRAPAPIFPHDPAKRYRSRYSISIRPRPWLAAILDRLR